MAILGTSTVPAAGGANTADRLNVQLYTVSGGDFTVTAMHAYVGTVSGSFRVVVYDSTGSGGDPNNLVCYSPDLASTGSAIPPGTDISGSPNTGAVLTNGVGYWIGMHWGSTAQVGTPGGSTVATKRQTGATFASGAPNPYTVSLATSASPQSIWLVGTQGSAAVFIPQIAVT